MHVIIMLHCLSSVHYCNRAVNTAHFTFLELSIWITYCWWVIQLQLRSNPKKAKFSSCVKIIWNIPTIKGPFQWFSRKFRNVWGQMVGCTNHGVLLPPSGYSPGMRLNIQRCTRQPTHKETKPKKSQQCQGWETLDHSNHYRQKITSPSWLPRCSP